MRLVKEAWGTKYEPENDEDVSLLQSYISNKVRLTGYERNPGSSFSALIAPEFFYRPGLGFTGVVTLLDRGEIDEEASEILGYPTPVRKSFTALFLVAGIEKKPGDLDVDAVVAVDCPNVPDLTPRSLTAIHFWPKALRQVTGEFDMPTTCHDIARAKAS